MTSRPIDRRVWYAHKRVWRQRYPRLPAEFYAAIQERYFPGIDPKWKCPDEIADITVDYDSAAQAPPKPAPAAHADIPPPTRDGVPTLSLTEAAEQLGMTPDGVEGMLGALLAADTAGCPRMTLLETPFDPVPGVLLWLPDATPREERDAAVRRLSAVVGPYGVFAAEYRASLREPLPEFALALVRVPDVADLIDAYQTGSPDGSDAVESVREAVAGWRERYGVTVLAIGLDSLRLHFREPAAGDGDLIAEILEVCSDVATYDDYGDVAEVTERLRRTGIVEMFWT
jgi:hypothetical protein